MKRLLWLILFIGLVYPQTQGGTGVANTVTIPDDILINGQIILENIDEFTEEGTPTTSDSVLIWDSSADNYDRAALGDLPGGSAFEIDQLDEDAIAVTDSMAFWDVTGDHHNREVVADILSLLVGGEGLSLTAQTFDLDIDNLTEDAILATDSLLFWDVTGNDHNREVVADLLNLAPGNQQRYSITIEDPASDDDITIAFTNRAITITEMRAVVANGTATPSVTWTIKHHATDRNNAGNEVVTSGTTTTDDNSGSDVTAFNDADIPADSFVWIETTAQSGTVPELHVTIIYTVD